VVNNLEFDHADIFDSIKDIQKQFHHLVKILPQNAQVISNQESGYFDEVVNQGIWSEHVRFGNEASDAQWQYRASDTNPHEFQLGHGEQTFTVSTPLLGEHNIQNAVGAIAAAHHAGIPIEHCIESLDRFKSVKRRLELIYTDENVSVYDDFAHHPTAIEHTVNALKAVVKDGRVIAILEPRSNTMKMGIHQTTLANSLKSADQVKVFADKSVLWNIQDLESEHCRTYDTTQTLIDDVINETQSGDHILVMSNGGFENLHNRLIAGLKKRHL
jgi:UDP-N-acetylmuramate: L-alanyl-gamma-D-glutamyl-meso-diaminopimelate ligase